MGIARIGRVVRRGHTIKDVAVGLSCLVVAGCLLVSLTGANRNLSRAQVCMGNLRQMYAGVTAYVNQYNSYPPNNPYPTYTSSQVIHGLSTTAWDPSIGFILTHGLGLQPPATDSKGHFIWYVLNEDELPEVCVCPSRAPWLLVPNAEIDTYNALESFIYQYALAYQTSGTCRAACPVVKPQAGSTPGIGGRNSPIPDPTSPATQQPYSNATRVIPYVWARKKDPTKPLDDPSYTSEYNCWVQAVHPSEVDHPSRVYYLADSRDYRPVPTGYPPAGQNSGWASGYGNKVFLGTRHFQYANVMYLDGRVSRDEQTHYAQWNMNYFPFGQTTSPAWRCATFATEVTLAGIHTQLHTMPVLMVKGWEYFFNADGLRPR